MLITFLVILTYSFEMAAIWYFSLICSVAHTNSHGNFTCGMHKHKWPYYMLITFLVILTHSFETAATWYFSLVCCQ